MACNHECCGRLRNDAGDEISNFRFDQNQVDEKADSFPEKDPTVGFREFVKHIDEAAIVKYVTDSILNSTPINVSCDDEKYVTLALVSLRLFVQLNWTGPKALSKDDLATILSLTQSGLDQLEMASVSWLSVDGETFYEKAEMPTLLAMSRLILSSAQERTLHWVIWELRSIYIHQSMVDSSCQSLKSQAMACINSLISAAGLEVKDKPFQLSENQTLLVDRPVSSLTYSISEKCKKYPCSMLPLLNWRLNAANLARTYFEYETCKTLLRSAFDVACLSVDFDGVIGKRTRYQKKSLPQLLLKVSRQSDRPQHLDRSICPNLPRNEPLQDDTVLEVLNLDEDREAPLLTADEQALLLALCEENSYVKAEDVDIKNEESDAYYRAILSDPCDWSVQCKTLLLRSLTEKHSGRRLERSLRQLEELSIVSRYEKPSVGDRLAQVYGVCLPPIWQVQKSLGDLHVEIGAFASAMEVFDRLCLWEPLIVCSHRAGRSGKAEEIIRQRLAVKETPVLYCSLSDVTNDPQFYHKAWELSGHRSARAMRGLAFYHLRACEYEEAMACFEKTLGINSLQLNCWFSYGCASLASQIYDKAATAFRRSVYLNPDNFEAWNNLAAAYLRSGQKARAFAVLQDAVKCSYDDWRVWENYVLIGADCGQVSEAIRGAHRLLELKDRWSDDMIVEHLTKMVLEDLPDAKGKASSLHRSSLLKLLGHTTAKTTNSSAVWKCYGRLILSSSDPSPENLERGVQCLQKAYRCACNNAKWEKDLKLCEKNTDILTELVESYKRLGGKKYIGTARLQLKGHMAKLRQAHTDSVTGELDSTVQQLVDQLQPHLDSLVDV